MSDFFEKAVVDNIGVYADTKNSHSLSLGVNEALRR